MSRDSASSGITDRAQNALARIVIRAALTLPVRVRIGVMRFVIGDILGPLVGWRRRALDNLAYVWPDRPLRQRQAIARAALRSAAQVLIENYDPDELRARGARFAVTGAGVPALLAARDEGRPILMITGHYGNHEAIRAALHHKGLHAGGIYRPMHNPGFNAHYVAAMERMGTPVFPADARGTARFLRALQQGHPMVLLNDLHVWRAERMTFLGKPARTALSAARMAIRSGAVMLPVYATRDARDRTLYSIDIDPPVPHGTPLEMTQILTESIERRILADPGQWFWIHRRWKR